MDATFSFKDDDFVKVATGKMNPQIAFIRFVHSLIPLSISFTLHYTCMFSSFNRSLNHKIQQTQAFSKILSCV